MDAMVVGAGAQGRITVELLRAIGRWNAVVVADDNAALKGTELLGAKVIGPAGEVPEAERANYEVVVALGHPEVRTTVAERLAGMGYRFLTAVHPSAIVAPSVTVGPGTVVCPGAIVHTEAKIGAQVIINTGALVEHDSVVEDAACISPRTVVSGRVNIGRAAFLAVNTLVLPRLTIGAGAVVGASSVVMADIPPRAFALGSPARILGKVDENFDWKRLF